MDKKLLKSPEFVAFCERVKSQLGEASDEILYAWYYDTFEVEPKQKDPQGNQGNQNKTQPPANTGATQTPDEKK